MADFDPSKPYSSFHPIHNGAKYEQDGVLFRADGKPVEEKPRRGRPPKPTPVDNVTEIGVAAEVKTTVIGAGTDPEAA